MKDETFQLEAENILEVLRAVAECVPVSKGADVRLLPPLAGGTAPEAREEKALTAAVAIDGAWRGTVMVEYSPRIASQIAAAMFGDNRVSSEDVKDAIGEVAQIVSGNLKAFVAHRTGAECRLSLPVVDMLGKTGLFQGCRHRAEFVWAGEPVTIRICPGTLPVNDARRRLAPEVS